MESGKKLLRFQEFDFRPDLKRICEGFALLAQHDITFEYELGEGPYNIRAEKFHLENVIGNLLENARKYSDNPKVTLTAQTQKGHLLVHISDNGQGIAKEDIKKFLANIIG